MQNSIFPNIVENFGEQVKVKVICNPEKLKKLVSNQNTVAVKFSIEMQKQSLVQLMWIYSILL